MKRYVGLLVISLFFATAPLVMAQERTDHIEVGAFADYYRFGDVDPHQNFIGLGARAAVGLHPNVQLEAEMAYDFKRNFTRTFTCSNPSGCNGLTTEFVNSHFRTLHGFFGPKFQTGSGPFRVFISGKAGFDNFSITNDNAGSGFVSSVGLTSGTTNFALYPSGGFEAFAGPIGIRAEAGDDIFFNHGAHNQLRVTLGPQFRF
jgi:hypothetical protein